MQILVVRVGRVGDTVMITPALNAIIDCYPDAEITILASPGGKRLLHGFNPRIKATWTWNRHGLLRPLLEKRRLRRLLEQNRFDHIFCFDTNPRIASLFDQESPAFHWFRGSTQRKHSARHYLEHVAESCRIDIDHYYYFLPLKEDARTAVDDELASHGITPANRVVMMHPTFSGYSRFWIRKKSAMIRKIWPAEHYAGLGRRLSQARTSDGEAIRPLMVLLPGDMELGRKIVALSDNSITLLEDRSGFERYKALVSRADVIVTPDSGPMHIASALGTKIVAFFSQKDPSDCGPYMEANRYRILSSDDPVHGISIIDIDTVFASVMALLDNSDTGARSSATQPAQ